jgi:hypothetical protein
MPAPGVVKPVLDAVSAIAPATAIFVIGQILTRFVLEPIQEQARTVGRIAFCLLAYADLDPESHKIERLDEASRALRELAAQLRASRRVIPGYTFLALIRCVISKRVLLESSAALIHWSDDVYNGNTRAYRQRLAELLKVPGLDLIEPHAQPTTAADDDLTDDEDETPVYVHRNICTLLAQDAPKSMAA